MKVLKIVLCLSILWPGFCSISIAEESFLPLSGLWRFSNGPEFPGASGTLTARPDNGAGIAYDFSRGGAYVGAWLDLEKPIALSRLRLVIHGPEDGLFTLRVTDATGQDFQKPMDWNHSPKAVTIDLARWTASWGGAADAVFHPPVKSIAVLIEGNGLSSPKGEYVIGEVYGAEGRINESRPYDGRYVVTRWEAESGFTPGAHASLEGALLKADFTENKGESGLYHSLSLFGRPKSLAIYIHGGTPGMHLNLTLGSHFQTFSKTLGVIEGKSQVFTTSMPPDGWTHGGAEEKNISYPLRITALTLSPGEDTPKEAEVFLDRMECATTLPTGESVTLLSTLNQSKEASSTAWNAEVRGWNLQESAVTGVLTMVMRDWEDRILAEATIPWTLAGGGACERYTWPVTIPDTVNFADVAFSFSADGVPPAKACSGYTRPLPLSGDATLHPESPWGMGVYLYRYPADGLLMDRVAGLAQAAGIRWSREEFNWAMMEREAGSYDFSFYDTVVDTAHRHGISVYGLLAYWGRFTQPYTEKGIDDFCRWAQATVHHFKDRVKYWEIYNEPNIFFWDGPKELYPELVRRCHAVIKAEDSEATVLAVSTSGIDRPFIRKVVDSGAPFDILTVHPYRGEMKERVFIRELKDAQKLTGGKPTWITEMGWPTHIGGGVDERTQAQLIARCYMAAVGYGGVANMGWYDFRDDGKDPFFNEANFGVIRENTTPKPAYRALATLCHALAAGKCEPIETSLPDIWGVRSGDTVVLWNSGDTVSVKARFRKTPEKIFNLMGDPLYPEERARKMKLTLRTGCPIFLVRTGNVKVSLASPE